MNNLSNLLNVADQFKVLKLYNTHVVLDLNIFFNLIVLEIGLCSLRTIHLHFDKLDYLESISIQQTTICPMLKWLLIHDPVRQLTVFYPEKLIYLNVKYLHLNLNLFTNLKQLIIIKITAEGVNNLNQMRLFR